ncbi:MAG: AAA family ATPase [Bacteroidetes bacterium]|nr:AAA family ATPase [Bacteroidota bacterium]
MQLSIYNFKGIKELSGFRILPLNIVSGVNSSGKSSLIQFFLLLKQTIRRKAVDSAFVSEGDIIELGEYKDLVYKKSADTNIAATITFSKDEISLPELDYLKISLIEFSIVFGSNMSSAIDKIRISYKTPEFAKAEQWISFTKTEEGFAVDTNTGVFNTEFQDLIVPDENLPVGELLFASIFPQVYQTEVANPNYPEIEKLPTKPKTIQVRIEALQQEIEKAFSGISYIGPLREMPRDTYIGNKKDRSIGNRGEYAAYILEKEAGQMIEYHTVKTDENGKIFFQLVRGTLASGVRYWICDVFKLAKDIQAIENNEQYIIRVTNNFGIVSTIKHVGFGISQILPVIVEGLRMRKGGLLILEQPEIHLHPKIQSSLFDFLYSLSLVDKKILIETHSDHFITRMRRRVAEDPANNLDNNINLVFVEEYASEHVFRQLDLTDLGSLSYYPKDFVEQMEVEYRYIVKAQAEKRKIISKANGNSGGN